MKIFASNIFLVCLLTLFISCDKKKAQDTPAEHPTEQEEQSPTAEENEGSGEVKEKPYQLAGFQKTACYGKCPVYQVKFYSDNTATWHGKMNVERMGWHEAKVDKEQIKAIKDKAFEIGYFDFYGEYPLEYKVADLPSTITYIRVGDMEKTIKNTHDGPDKLTEFEQYLESLIENLDWKAMEKD